MAEIKSYNPNPQKHPITGEKVSLDHNRNVQTLSPEEQEANFKKWFGKSVVVDKSGKPLKVIHSSKYRFNSFIPSAQIDVGSHFGDVSASDKIHNPDKMSEILYYPVYLKIENPIEFVDPITWDIASMGEKLVELGIMTQGMVNVLTKKFNIHYKTWIEDKSKDRLIPQGIREIQSNIIALCLQKKYDGIIYANRAELDESDLELMTGSDFDSPNDEFMMKFKSSTWSYCTFQANQVKSIYNRGTWDASSDNLSEAKRG